MTIVDNEIERRLVPLIGEYLQWLADNNLHDRGSAEEYLADDSISIEQRAWLTAFVDRWYAACDNRLPWTQEANLNR